MPEATGRQCPDRWRATTAQPWNGRDLGTALAHLREVRDKYWDHDWRREHRGYGRCPENELWDAVEGYLDLLDASRSSDPDA